MENKLSTYFSFFVAVYVIFNRYASPIPKVTLSEFILFIFWGFFFTLHLKKFRVEWSLVPFCIYLLGYVVAPFTGLIPHVVDMADWVGTAARLLLIYISIAVLGKTLFDVEKGIKFIRYVAVGLAAYACVQIVAAKMGIYLTTYLPFLPSMESKDIDMVIANRSILYGLSYRASSLLIEPAHLSTYLIAVLGLELFGRAHKGRYIIAVFLSLVVLQTLSSTGFIMTGLTWLMFFFQNNRLTLKQFLGGAIVAIVGLFAMGIFAYHAGIWDTFLNRVFFNESGSLMESTRFYALQDMFSASHSLTGVLFGRGLSNLENYLPGFARIYLCLGLNGLVLTLFFLFRMYTHKISFQKNMVLVFAVLNIGTESILGAFALMYLCLIAAPCAEHTNISAERDRI